MPGLKMASCNSAKPSPKATQLRRAFTIESAVVITSHKKYKESPIVQLKLIIRDSLFKDLDYLQSALLPSFIGRLYSVHGTDHSES